MRGRGAAAGGVSCASAVTKDPALSKFAEKQAVKVTMSGWPSAGNGKVIPYCNALLLCFPTLLLPRPCGLELFLSFPRPRCTSLAPVLSDAEIVDLQIWCSQFDNLLLYCRMKIVGREKASTPLEAQSNPRAR